MHRGLTAICIVVCLCGLSVLPYEWYVEHYSGTEFYSETGRVGESRPAPRGSIEFFGVDEYRNVPFPDVTLTEDMSPMRAVIAFENVDPVDAENLRFTLMCHLRLADDKGPIHDDRLVRYEPAWKTDDTVYFGSISQDPFRVPRDGTFRISCNFEEPLGAPLSIARLTLRRNVRTVSLWMVVVGCALALGGSMGFIALRESARSRLA